MKNSLRPALHVAGDGGLRFARRSEAMIEGPVDRHLDANTTPPYKFGYARTALKYGLRALQLQPGDALLVPDFNCEAIVEPLDALGITPVYYPVGEALQPDWQAMHHLVKASVKGLLIVHYFGQPQLITACQEFCRHHSLLLIEDNAHGFGATFNGQLLGTFGDVGVSSPRKSFPIPNGAYLHLAADIHLDLHDLRLQPARDSRKNRLKRRIQKLPFFATVDQYRRDRVEYRNRLGPPPAYHSQAAFREGPLLDDYGMDQSTAHYLQQQDVSKIRRVRTDIYYLWQNWANQQGLTPVFPGLSDGAMPLVYPAYIDQSLAMSPKVWFERGHRAGVDIHSWPTFPEAILKQDGNAVRVWEKMICFPIYQDMNVTVLRDRIKVL
jgi:perosamine synthetase